MLGTVDTMGTMSLVISHATRRMLRTLPVHAYYFQIDRSTFRLDISARFADSEFGPEFTWNSFVAAPDSLLLPVPQDLLQYAPDGSCRIHVRTALSRCAEWMRYWHIREFRTINLSFWEDSVGLHIVYAPVNKTN